MPSRREFLRLTAVVLPGMFLSACSGEVPKSVPVPTPGNILRHTEPPSRIQDESSSAPETENWIEARIPAKEVVVTIKDVGPHHFPQIGLKRLYLVADPSTAMLAVVPVFNKETTKTPGENSLRLSGTIGFQRLKDPFVPNPAEIPLVPKTKDGQRQAIDFGAMSFVKIQSLPGSDLTKNPHMIWISPRPLDDNTYALVFGGDLVEYQNKPSPTSFLAIKFTFERMPDLVKKTIT